MFNNWVSWQPLEVGVKKLHQHNSQEKCATALVNQRCQDLRLVKYLVRLSTLA